VRLEGLGKLKTFNATFIVLKRQICLSVNEGGRERRTQFAEEQML
jgi:hypothetical protein